MKRRNLNLKHFSLKHKKLPLITMLLRLVYHSMYGVNETMENISVFGSNLFALFFLDFYLNLFGNKLDFSLLSYIKY